MTDEINCRIGCGACCIIPMIPIPYKNHPNGKNSFERCKNLNEKNECMIYDERPEPCRRFKPKRSTCGKTNEEAFEILSAIEPLQPMPTKIRIENGRVWRDD